MSGVIFKGLFLSSDKTLRHLYKSAQNYFKRIVSLKTTTSLYNGVL